MKLHRHKAIGIVTVVTFHVVMAEGGQLSFECLNNWEVKVYDRANKLWSFLISALRPPSEKTTFHARVTRCTFRSRSSWLGIHTFTATDGTISDRFSLFLHVHDAPNAVACLHVLERFVDAA